MPIDTYPGLVVPTLYKARAHAATATSIGSGVTQTITLDAEDYDPNNNFAGNTYTVPVTGQYVVAFAATCQLQNNPQDFFAVLYVNGVETVQGSRFVLRGGTAGDWMGSRCSDIITLTAGDTLTLRAFNNGGNALNTLNSSPHTFLSVHLFSPVPGAVAISNPNYSPPTTYAPVWSSTGTAPTVGNGSVFGRYTLFGKICLVQLQFTFGSTSNGGTGDWRFSLPLAHQGAHNAGDFSMGGPVSGTDAGSKEYIGSARIINVSGTSNIEILPTSDATNPTSRWAATVPFTWGNADGFTTGFAYEIQ